MARAKYRITKNDFYTAKTWVAKKLDGLDFPRSSSGDNDAFHAAFKANSAAKEDFEAIEWGDEEGPEKLTLWGEKHMNTKQWGQLKGAIRAQRNRRGMFKKTVSVDLSRDAHRQLETLAKRDGVTLSEMIVRLTREPYLDAIQEDLYKDD